MSLRPKRKIRPRVLIFAAAGIAAVGTLILAFSIYWERKQEPFQNFPALISALQMFARDQARTGSPVPAEIPLSALVQKGYLATNDVRAFDGIDLVFMTHTDGSHPQAILARARMANGQFICVLADGSVQQFTGSRYEKFVRDGQPGSTTNRNQRIQLETNRTPAASGADH